MQRDIEFRAWDKLNEEMLKVYKIDFNNEEAEFEFEDSLCFSEIELMQYTGLKDKNGVKIFEGDMVKSTNTGEVFTIAFVQERLRFCLIDKYGEDYGFTHVEGLEVIGNIYGNPELAL